MGDSIVRKTDTRLSKEEDVVVCLPGARIEHVTERVEKIMGRGKGGTILVHIGTNNADKEGTTAIVDKYRKLLKKTKEARVEQIILSGILPVFGNRLDGYRNSKRMAINRMVKRLCKEEDVGYVDLWDSFVGKEVMYGRDGLHLSGKGAAVFPDSGCKGIQGNTSKAELKCVCLNARSIINKKNELDILVDEKKPHIIGITESWANNDITDAELGLDCRWKVM